MLGHNELEQFHLWANVATLLFSWPRTKLLPFSMACHWQCRHCRHCVVAGLAVIV
jgi:hypothetical protein